MNCNNEDIGALLDGEVDAVQKGAVERHLLNCAGCRETKELMLSLSSVLKVSPVAEPSTVLRSRIKESFRDRYPAKQAVWRRVLFGGFVVPKPVFAMLLILASAGFWLSFQIGKINSSAITMTVPPTEIANALPINSGNETKIETVLVEVPVVKVKTMVRIVHAGSSRRGIRAKGGKPHDGSQNGLPTFNSTTTAKGLSNEVNLKGFQPPAEMTARVIKEHHDEE